MAWFQRERIDGATLFTPEKKRIPGSSGTVSFDVSDKIEQAIESLRDPITGSPSRGKAVSGIICLHVDNLCRRSRVLPIRHVFNPKDCQIGPEDAHDVSLVGQRVCWKTEGSNSFIQVDQERCIEELGELEFDSSLPDTDYCSAALPFAIQKSTRPGKWAAVEHTVSGVLPVFTLCVCLCRPHKC